MTFLRVFIPFALGYFLSYLLRVVNAVIAPDIVSEIDLTAADLGLMTGVSFLAFAAFQLPLGILLDRYGPRRSEAAILLLAVLGTSIFALAHSATGLIVGRALIGMGTSACLMAAFKAYVMWFPKDRLPLINGLHMAIGGMGALSATVPIEMALQYTDWRGILFFLGALALVFSITIYFVVPKRTTTSETTSETMSQQLGGIKAVFTSSLFWRIAPITVTSQASFLAIQSLWTGPWLADVGGLDRSSVADYLFMIAVGMVFGFLCLGFVAERLTRFGIKTINVSIICMGIFVALQLCIAYQIFDNFLPIWILFGFFGTTGILPYSVLIQSFPISISGRVITGINTLVFSGSFIAQWGIGEIINLWPTVASGGYHPEGYRAAFLTMVALQILGLLWYLSQVRKPIETR